MTTESKGRDYDVLAVRYNETASVITCYIHITYLLPMIRTDYLIRVSKLAVQ